MWLAQATAGPGAGNATAGFMGRLISASATPVIGGLVCVAGAVTVALAMPKFRQASLRDSTADELERAGVTHAGR